MRKLIYVPVIHTDADLGQLAEGVEEKAKETVGNENWQKHKEVVRRYWREIEKFWQEKKVSGFKIFQDGMAAGGAVGRTILQDLALRGSINHQIIKGLVKKGAQLVKTEDAKLLKEEYSLTRELINRKSFLGSLLALFRYKLRKGKLLKERDAYIVRRIDESLKKGETGICFLGAYHQVLDSLPADFTVTTLKDPQKVREYYQKFTHSIWEGEVHGLAEYLTTPIKIRLGNKYD